MIGRSVLSMSALSLYRSAVQFGLSMLMARFISPAEYGLLAFTTPFIAFLGLMTDLGLSSAIVRTADISARQVAAAFTMTLAVGVSLGLALALAAFPIAHLTAMRGLGPVMAAMAGVVMLNVWSATPRALLEKRLSYSLIAGVEAAAVLIAAAAAVGAALLGAGVWSLVLYNLLNQALRATSFGWLSRRALRLEMHWGGLKPLLSFGGWVLASNMLTFLSRNSDNLLIGGVLGSTAVGLYGLSYQFMLAPLMAITWPASSVLLAALTRGGLRPARVGETVRGVMCATAALSFPAMAYLTFGLSWPVGALLSPHWQAVPGVVAWLAPVGALQSISSYSGAVLMAAGLARRQFLLNAAGSVVTVAVFVATVRAGLPTLVHAYAVVASLVSLATLAATVASTSLSWSDVGRALLPGAAATALGALAASVAGVLGAPGPQAWALQTAAFGLGVLATYAVLWTDLREAAVLLWRPRAEPA